MLYEPGPLPMYLLNVWQDAAVDLQCLCAVVSLLLDSGYGPQRSSVSHDSSRVYDLDAENAASSVRHLMKLRWNHVTCIGDYRGYHEDCHVAPMLVSLLRDAGHFYYFLF